MHGKCVRRTSQNVKILTVAFFRSRDEGYFFFCIFSFLNCILNVIYVGYLKKQNQQYFIFKRLTMNQMALTSEAEKPRDLQILAPTRGARGASVIWGLVEAVLTHQCSESLITPFALVELITNPQKECAETAK